MKIGKLVIAAALVISPMFAQAKSITVQVKGMVCSFCAQGIEKKFKDLAEIASVKVSLETKKVDLNTKEGKDVPDDKIRKIISDAGYDVLKIERTK